MTEENQEYIKIDFPIPSHFRMVIDNAEDIDDVEYLAILDWLKGYRKIKITDDFTLFYYDESPLYCLDSSDLIGIRIGEKIFYCNESLEQDTENDIR